MNDHPLTHNVIGIDPGVSGAIALNVDGELAIVEDTPSIDKRVNVAVLSQMIGAWHSRHPITKVVIENVHAMPKQGVSSSFNFGRALGDVEGCVIALGHVVEFVSPAVWKRDLGLTGKDKAASRQLATDMWPSWADAFKRVKDDGRAEAALLAHWGTRET